VNSVLLEGRLATGVNTKDFPRSDGAEVLRRAEFLMAVNKRRRDAEPDWIWVTCFGRLAETCAQYLVKGTQVTVRARVSGRFTEKDRTKKGRLRLSIIAEEVAFGQRPKAAEEASKGGRRS